MAARKAPTQYKFLTLESECGALFQMSFGSGDDSFTTPELAVMDAARRLEDTSNDVDAIYIVEVIGVVKKNKAAYTPIGTKSAHDLAD